MWLVFCCCFFSKIIAKKLVICIFLKNYKEAYKI